MLSNQHKQSDRSYLKNKTQFERKLKTLASGKNNDFSYGFVQPGGINDFGNDYFPNLDSEQDNNNNYNNNISEQFTEEINVISSLWDDLGVTDYYRVIFESLLKDLDSDMRKDLLDHEMFSLKKFSDCLLVRLFFWILFNLFYYSFF